MPKTTEQNRIVCTSKSEAEVIKKLRLRYYTIDTTKLTTDRHEASFGLFATAELLLSVVCMCDVSVIVSYVYIVH